MELTAFAVTAITDFILAGEAFFLSGLLFARPKAPRSAAWFWQIALLLLATSALVGGIDHGFLEVLGQVPAHTVFQRLYSFFIGLLVLFVLLTVARQYFQPPIRSILYVIAAVQLVVYTALILMLGSFLVVIINYVPVMLLLLIMSARGLADGTGSWVMIAGIVISFIASGVQAAGIDELSPFDRNSLYHFGLMVAVVCFYLGGTQLKTDR